MDKFYNKAKLSLVHKNMSSFWNNILQCMEYKDSVKLGIDNVRTTSFELLTTLPQNNEYVLYFIGLKHHINKNETEANKYMFESTKIRPIIYALYHIAKSYEKGRGIEKNVKRSVFYFEKYLRIENSAELYVDYGIHCYETKKIPNNIRRAVRFLLKALYLENDNLDALIYLGRIHFRNLGKYEKAKQYFTKILEYDFKNIYALYGLGCIYDDEKYDEHSFEKARNYYKLAWISEPTHYKASYKYGLYCYKGIGGDVDMDEAVLHFKEILKAMEDYKMPILDDEQIKIMNDCFKKIEENIIKL